MTVREFMLKKYPTNEWIDCPVPKHHWETIQEYADKYHEAKVKNLSSNTVLAVLKEVDDVLTRRFSKDIWLKGMYNDEVIYIGCEKHHSIKIRIEVVE